MWELISTPACLPAVYCFKEQNYKNMDIFRTDADDIYKEAILYPIIQWFKKH